MAQQPSAFMSYTQFDDTHSGNRLSDLRTYLADEVRALSGNETFAIFQDVENIRVGQSITERINESLDVVTVLIPIVTPSFLRSAWCRGEVERFLERQEVLQRKDLILPVYFIDIPDEGEVVQSDEVARALIGRGNVRYVDWRPLRHQPLDSLEVREKLGWFAKQILEAIKRAPPVQVTPSPTPPDTTKPQRYVVDQSMVNPLPDGHYRKINEAIKAAQPGARILVHPGRYSEGLVIDKPLDIVGEGERADIVVETRGQATVLFKATMGHIANLTLKQLGEEDHYSVEIAQGFLELEECHITSQGPACVAIHGDAKPHLHHNRITNGKKSGILVSDKSAGLLRDNDIFNHALNGVEIKTDGNPVLWHNHIHNCGGGGVLVSDGTSLLSDNNIFDNAYSGVEIKGNGNPTLRHNCIHNGKAGGVYVNDGGQGTLEDNDIYNNTLSGVSISTKGNPTVRGNDIRKNHTHGVYVSNNGKGLLESNKIFGNEYAGVEIEVGSDPTLRWNRICDGKTSGVYIHDGGNGTLEGNDIYNNRYSGVSISTKGNPTVRGNRIYDGVAEGVVVYKGGVGWLEDNDIFDNAKSGVEIKDVSSNPTLTNNFIHGNKANGVYINHGGQGKLEHNRIFSNDKCGIVIETNANPTVRVNYVRWNKYQGVLIQQNGGGIVKDNDLRNNRGGTHHVSDDSTAALA